MLNPAYKLTLGTQQVDSTDEPRASTLVDLVVRLDMEVAADQYKLKLGNVGFLTPAREDRGKIELGYAGAESGLSQVMVGNVETVQQGSTIDVIHGYTSAAILLRSFTNKTYESMSAGQIVQDLAQQAGVTVERAEPGIQFPAYVIDDRASFYHHMRDLADLCGFDVYFNNDDKLVFRRYTGGQVHVFDHAKHIIELRVEYNTAPASQVKAFGESGSGNGTESWAWLTKDFSALAGRAGNGDPLMLLERSALRTGNAAQTAADGLNTALQRRQIRGSLLSVGRPQIKLGDAVRLNGLPEQPLNQTYQVRGLLHRMTKQLGFTTRVNFQSVTVNP